MQQNHQQGLVQEANGTFIELKPHCKILQGIAHAANQKWLSRVDKARSCSYFVLSTRNVFVAQILFCMNL
jgi:hypothetical protein